MGLWRGVCDLSPFAVEKRVLPETRAESRCFVFCLAEIFTTNFFLREQFLKHVSYAKTGVLCVLQAVQSLEISFGLP